MQFSGSSSTAMLSIDTILHVLQFSFHPYAALLLPIVLDTIFFVCLITQWPQAFVVRFYSRTVIMKIFTNSRAVIECICSCSIEYVVVFWAKINVRVIFYR